MGRGRVPCGGGAGGPTQRQVRRRSARERRKWAGAAIVAHEQGRREGGAWATIGAHVGRPEGIVVFFDLMKVISNGIDLIQIKDGLPEI
jgi:hypothetical protein